MLALAVPLAGLVACSLDWTVRPATSTDGGPDVIGADVVEGGADADGSAPTEGGVDGGQDDAAACAALASADGGIGVAEDRARECSLASNHCETTITDECGCEVVVRDKDTDAGRAFASAVAAFDQNCGNQGCPPSCPALPLPSVWTCLQQSPAIFRCSPAPRTRPR